MKMTKQEADEALDRFGKLLDRFWDTVDKFATITKEYNEAMDRNMARAEAILAEQKRMVEQ